MNYVDYSPDRERQARTASSMSKKEREEFREELARDVEAFLKANGRVVQLPIDFHRGNTRGRRCKYANTDLGVFTVQGSANPPKLGQIELDLN